MMSIGQNVTAEISGSILTLRVDLSQTIGPSKSQKSVLIASTNGSATLATGEKIGLNIYRKAVGQ